MREIKFRAWDSYFKSFTGFIIEKDKNNEDRIFFKKANHYSDYCLGENKTRFFLMQYTGLKDKNGKEIYEGDIVRLYEWEQGFEYTDRKVVFFQGCFKVEDMNDGYFCNIDLVNLSLCEVVGNIYENPELLKESI